MHGGVKLYPIGQFSKIGKVSTKMLRHYDKIGLLKPGYTNPDTGYRYYHKSQIKDILLINKLKSYRFSLVEIRNVLQKEDLKNLTDKLKEKTLYLSEEIVTCQLVLKNMEEEIRLLEKGEDFKMAKRTFDIVVDELKSILVLSVRKTISMAQIGELFGVLCENMHKYSITPIGNHMTIHYDKDFDPNFADVEVCIPIDKKVEIEGLTTRTLLKGLYAHTTYIGTYSELGEGYAALLDWIEENNYEIVGPPVEEYIKGPGANCNPKDFITEIYFPIKK